MKALPVFFLLGISGVVLSVSLPLTSINTARNPSRFSNPIAYQIVINEIMADPNPPVMLPDFEYIELLNRSDEAVDLSCWELWIGNHKKILPATVMQAGEYRIVCESKADSLFCRYGKTIPVGSSLSILNTGQTITLKTPSGEIIHSVSFSDEWYNTNPFPGGKSLEMMDPDNPCEKNDNWKESLDNRGGSPGIINSVYSSNPDQQHPQLLRASLPSDSAILLYFSESMNGSSLYSANSYSVNHNILHPSAVKPVEPDFNTALLEFLYPFHPSYLYTVNVLSDLTDCTGNKITGSLSVDFAVSQPPSTFDAVINEVMPDPAENTSEFIELYNRSEKTLDLTSLILSLADCQTGLVEKTVSFANHAFLLLPDHYVVITRQGQKLPGNAYLSNLPEILEQTDLFTLPNEEGLIVLSDTASQIIDEFHYSSSLHDGMLHSTRGVSLERVNPDDPSDDPGNWHSASTTSGYATPGEKNSQLITENQGFSVNLTPDAFSPDNDGIDDYALLHLRFGDPGWKGSIMIFNQEGVKVKSLVTNSMLGTDETVVWDGKYSDGHPAEMGLYIFFGTLYNSQGKVESFKCVISLVKKI